MNIYFSSFNQNRNNYTRQILDEIANLTYAVSKDENTTVADLLSSCLASNETCNITDLQKALLSGQSIVECVLSLGDNYTFGNEAGYVALDQLYWYNESAFEASNQRNCSAL